MLNEYCGAVVAKYGTLYAAQDFFNNFEWWCKEREDYEDTGKEMDSTRCTSEDMDGCSDYQTLTSRTKADVSEVREAAREATAEAR